MNIKYLLTNDKNLIINLFEKELCVLGISYVKIENEIHFNNNILRILDFSEIKLIDDKDLFSKLSENIEILETKFPDFEEKTIKTFKKLTKKDIKQDSHNLNQILKKKSLNIKRK